MNNRLTHTIAMILVAACFITAFFVLGNRLIGQFHGHLAKNAMLEERFADAVAALETATFWLATEDNLWRKLGEAYLAQARRKPYREAFPLYEKAKQACQKAAALNPHEAHNWFRLAMAEAGLQKLFPLVNESWQNPYNADPHFEKAVARFPHSGPYHLWYARHLGEQYR